LHHDDHGGEYDGDSEKFYAVKRARNQFIGYKDRLQKLQEVEIILKIGLDSPYCVHLQQAWEQRGHLYIQTDFYENGNLDNYLCHVLFDESMVWQALADLVLVFVLQNICLYLLIF
jgi:mitosis inhibitor protein kinase SWE1